MKRLALSALLAASLAPAAHAQYGWESMMNPMTMMNPAMMMNPMAMMAPMTMMSAPMMGGMASPQQYMTNPYLNPMAAANPYMMQPQPQAYFPMMPAAPAAAPAYGVPAYGYYPQPAAPAAAPAYGMPAYGYYPQPAAPQAAPAGTWDPATWMQMFSAPPAPAPAPAPARKDKPASRPRNPPWWRVFYWYPGQPKKFFRAGNKSGFASVCPMKASWPCVQFLTNLQEDLCV